MPACREALALAQLGRDEERSLRRDRVLEAQPLGDARGNGDRPADPGSDHSVDPLRLGQPLDRRLVLDGDDRAPVRVAEPGRRGVAVDRDHEQAAPASRGEQPELGRTCSEDEKTLCLHTVIVAMARDVALQCGRDPARRPRALHPLRQGPARVAVLRRSRRGRPRRAVHAARHGRNAAALRRAADPGTGRPRLGTARARAAYVQLPLADPVGAGALHRAPVGARRASSTAGTSTCRSPYGARRSASRPMT